jgi:5-(carboxyamino)imidazole ribonucleotide synthase
MVNCIGRMPPAARALGLEGVHVHDYGKSPRPGRKLGHLTFVGRSPRERDLMAGRLLRLARR